MPIKGLIQKSNYYPAIIHKGGPKPEKGYGFGKDLNDYFRIELRDPNLKYALLDSGIKKAPATLKTAEGDVIIGSPDGNYIAQTLDIFMPGDEIDSFETSMQLWDKTGLVHECDRDKIYQRREEYKDIFENVRTRMVGCDHPCAVKDEAIGVSCPKGCQSSGILKFYLAPFVDYGTFKECKLTVKSFYDIESIYSSLEAIKQEFGSIHSSPPGFPGYRGMIPLILKRVRIPIKRPILDANKKRTGKKADASMWVVAIAVNPDWIKSYYAWQQYQGIKKLGYTPQSDLLRQLPGASQEIQEVEVVSSFPDLPEPKSLPVPYLGEEEFKQIGSIFENQKQHPDWKNKEDFCASLKAYYGVPITKIELSEFQNVLDHLLTKKLTTEVREDLGF